MTYQVGYNMKEKEVDRFPLILEEKFGLCLFMVRLLVWRKFQKEYTLKMPFIMDNQIQIILIR